MPAVPDAAVGSGPAVASGPAAAETRILVVADDLIWATRLAAVVRATGAIAVPARRPEDVRATAAGAAGAIVDLTARGYDGPAMVAELVAAGVPVLCVAQHDDRELRRRVLAAGADRVLAYRTVHERGAAVLAGWPKATAGEAGPR